MSNTLANTLVLQFVQNLDNNPKSHGQNLIRMAAKTPSLPGDFVTSLEDHLLAILEELENILSGTSANPKTTKKTDPAILEALRQYLGIAEKPISEAGEITILAAAGKGLRKFIPAWKSFFQGAKAQTEKQSGATPLWTSLVNASQHMFHEDLRYRR